MKRSAVACLAFVLSGCGVVAPGMRGEEPQASIPMRVLKPDGEGPFPAVVVLHDCSGLGPQSSGAPGRWANVLLKQGYVVAMPDSFSTRGHANGVCTDASPSREEVNAYKRVPDAYEALDYLRKLPYVDGAHVGVMGGSHGGTTTLATVADSASDSQPMSERKHHGFSAAIALYPGCAAGRPRWTEHYQTHVPVLILSGERDDWTPAAACERLTAAAARDSSAPVAIKVYPGAHHSFDSPNPVRYNPARVNANAPSGRGATTGGDPDAWADSIREVQRFFGRYLRAS